MHERKLHTTRPALGVPGEKKKKINKKKTDYIIYLESNIRDLVGYARGYRFDYAPSSPAPDNSKRRE